MKTLSQPIKDVCAHLLLQMTPIIYSFYPATGLSLLVEYRGASVSSSPILTNVSSSESEGAYCSADF